MVLPTQGIRTEHRKSTRGITMSLTTEILSQHMVWSVRRRVIEGRVTGSYYRNFLGNELPLYLEDMPLTRRGRMCQRHEEASPHFGTQDTQLLNKDYEERKIERN